MNANIFKEISQSPDPKSLYKYVAAIIFLKWIYNNTVVDKYNFSTVTLEKNKNISIRSLKNLNFNDFPGEGNLGGHLELIFRELEAENSEQLGGLFGWIDFHNNCLQKNDDRYYYLKRISAICANINDDECSVFSQLLEVAETPSIETPPSIASLISGVINLTDQEEIFDPVCGNGSLLLSCAAVLENENFVLSGNECNHSAWFFAKLNLLLNGFSSRGVLHKDCFAEGVSGYDEKQYDAVVGHPPWGERFSDSYHWILESLLPNMGRNQITFLDYAFVFAILGKMKCENGRAAVLVSNGMLTRSGAESDIRRDLIEKNLLDAVIGLPDKMFTTTSIGTSILLFRSTRSIKEVLFVDARSYVTPGRVRNTLSDSAVKSIVSIVLNRTPLEGISKLVPPTEIAGQAYTINVPRYMNRASSKIESDPDFLYEKKISLRQEIDEATVVIDDILQMLKLHAK
jgi:type I restriction-modification system DNA methylase subunit